MNTNLLAIGNIFAGTSGIGQGPAKPAAIRNSKQFSSPTLDNRPFTNARGTETVDNTLVNPNNGPNNGQPSEFGPTPGTKVPQKGENNTNATKQNLTQIPTEQPSIIQIWLAQYSLNLEHGKEGVARKVVPKAGYELAQSLNNLRPDKSLSHAVKTAKTQISETVPIINQKQIGLKTALPVTSKKPPNEAEHTNRIQISNAKLPAVRGVTDQQSGEGLPLEGHVRTQNRITTANGKPEAVPVSKAFSSQQSPSLATEGFKSQAHVDAAGEITNVIQKPSIARKPVVPVDQKAPLVNPNIPRIQDKPSGPQFQFVRIDPEQSPLIAEHAVANKTAASQPIRTQTQHLSGPLADDVIEQGDNFRGKSASQQLHHPQFHVSTGQTKDRGSSASDSNSDSGFEQILSGNTTATYIAEQTSAFPEAIKADNMPAQTSSSDVSASITEQILESINSPSSQQAGTQQITIRLNPPELGKVFIKFEEQENQITGLLEVSKAQTRYEVEQALPQIIQSLADSGIQVRRLEVMLTNQNEQQSYRDESLQDGTFQQHHDFPEGSNPDNHDTVATNESDIFGHDGSYWGNLEPQMQITDNSINVLI